MLPRVVALRLANWVVLARANMIFIRQSVFCLSSCLLGPLL